MNNIYSCSVCPDKPCSKGVGDYPKNCPTIEDNQLIQESKIKYLEDKEINKLMVVATKLIKDEFGNFRSRAEEIKKLIQTMGYKKVGIAFCLSMGNETKRFVRMLSELDIEIIAICCKVGSIDSKFIFEVENKSNISTNFSAICNPIVQAEILNNHKTELNIIIGLCVGHDILFNKHINGLVTTLVIKDRNHNHCPIKEFTENKN